MNRPSFIRTFPLAALSALALIALTATAGSAQTNPYGAFGTPGYDVSYPSGNCSAQPVGQTFGIVGVNGGRPFSWNTCLGTEYTWALNHTTLPVSLYINTGYSGAYKRDINAKYCGSAPSGFTGSHAQAWEIGCSEAYSSINDAQNSYGIAPSAVYAWWLDVETGNSWSSSDVTLNQDTIQGAVTELLTVNANVGVYSDTSFWNTITGGKWTPTGLAADWTAAGGCAGAFTGSPVWLAQGGTTSGVDADSSCG